MHMKKKTSNDANESSDEEIQIDAIASLNDESNESDEEVDSPIIQFTDVVVPPLSCLCPSKNNCVEKRIRAILMIPWNFLLLIPLRVMENLDLVFIKQLIGMILMSTLI